jgi:hypothetical protein
LLLLFCSWVDAMDRHRAMRRGDFRNHMVLC